MKSLRHGAVGDWVLLMEFAIKRKVSLSTLRRQIKANKITYKIENGRYLLWDDELIDIQLKIGEEQSTLQKIQLDLLKAQEEIAELKTLIAFYEETLPPQKFTEIL
jgi:hypothetical protein